ncbi:hypothetical protein ACH5RR_004114 [Cinchona calisaya]|uniref:Regulator of Vps4 activity in the MVB pathway protein n=1 Tax=Cinchona calisaya TaxID=153742 RepID=A0ABD3AX95_9GENT
MKKSSFLHNPKDMLSKSFNPAKCKTALKLSASRMKLMKNKKVVQVKQMKRELAQLLDSGQDQTARIRVEHVIREEKMMAAYDLIDIYCELIVARLPIIESQKNCPIDLKEAITSVVFASPRCGDIPELLDARKHFTAKYGKDFISAALELRPNCGVSRLLVEKLSANAPDGQTKIKALTAIAEEHNIKWDPKSFGQSDILLPDDLLNGPSTFEKSSTVHAEAAHVTPDVQAPTSHHMMDYQPVNFSEQRLRSSQGTQNLDSNHNSTGSNRVSSIPQVQMRPSGIGVERGEVGRSFQGERNTSFTRQRWDMEFKDATSAAQAAAESAERASMAARAAAELSSRGRVATQPQYSSEVRNSLGGALRDKRTEKHVSSKYKSDYIPKDPSNRSFSDRQPRFQDKPLDRIEQDDYRLVENSYLDGHDNGKRYGHFASSNSKDSFQGDTSAHSFQIPPDSKLQKSLSKEENKVEISKQKQPGKSEIEGMNHLQEGYSSENFDNSGEERIRKQSSVRSSGSRSSIYSSDDRYSNSGHNIFGFGAEKDPSVGIDQEHTARDTSPPGYHASAAPVIFDDSGSDVDEIGVDTGFRHNEESNFHFASPGRNSPPHFPNNRGNESLKIKTGKSPESSISEFSTTKDSSPALSERLQAPADGSQEDSFGPVTFDDSDGANFKSETDMLHSGHHGTVGSSDFWTRQNISHGFSDTEMHRNDSYRTENVESENFGFGDSPASKSSFRLGKSRQGSNNAGSEFSFYSSVDEASKVSSVHEVKDNVSLSHLHGRQMDDESSDEGRELNFNKLTGGFRQKGYMHLPYTRSQVKDTSSSSKRVSDESPNTIQESAAYSTFESFANTGNNKGVVSGSSRLPNYHSDSDSDSSVEEFRKERANRRQDPNIQHAGKEDKKNSSLRGSVTYFDLESSDSEDDSAEQVFTSRNHLGSGFSRRTKASPSSSTSVSNSKSGSSSRVHVNSDSGVERNPNTRFYAAKTPQQSQSRNRNSDQQPNSEQPRSAKVASNPSSVSKITLPKETQKLSGIEPLPSSLQKMEASRSRTRNSDQRINPQQTITSKVESNPSSVSKKSLPEENQKSSAVEHPPSSGRKKETSDSIDNQKTKSGSAVSREDSLKKASHVHPKLPDYDTLAARIHALRMNHQ